MVAVNRMTTPANMRWKIIDRETGAENAAIDWQFKVGDQVKIRLLNEMAGDHPMHHPFHVHGAGRFLVLARDGAAESNLVWKDTVLVRTGETVDILLDVTNVGGVDGALPHRRAPRERDDVQLQRDAMSDRREVIVVGGGQAGLAIGYLLAQQRPAVHDPGGGRHAGGGVARAVGLAAAVHPGPLQQPPGPRVPRRPGHLPGPRRRRRLPHRLRARFRAAGRAGQPCPRRPAGRWRLPRRARRSHLRGRPGRDRHRPVPGSARARDRRSPGPEHRPVPQQRVPRAAGRARRAGTGRRWREHRLSDRRGTRPHPRGAPVDRVAADAIAATDPRPRSVPLPRSHRADEQDGRLEARPTDARPRDADRVEPTRRPPPAWHPSPRPHRRRIRGRGALRRPQPAHPRRGHLGHRLRARPRVRPAPGVRRGRPPRTSARRHRCAWPVLPRPAVAVHPRLGAAGLGRGRRRAHRAAHLSTRSCASLAVPA